MTISPSMQSKLKQMRRAAPMAVNKARLCGGVVLALLDPVGDLDAALQDLKTGLGSNWTTVTAFQFMSGKQALFAAECADENERDALIKAHQISLAVSNQAGITRLSMAQLRVVVIEAARVSTTP
jgi:hypothetical protein